MTALQYLISLRPALPMSKEKPCTAASNSELRRWLRDGAVLIDGERIAADEQVPFPVASLVLFPKSPSGRCTLV
jgi:hypothetical protein